MPSDYQQRKVSHSLFYFHLKGGLLSILIVILAIGGVTYHIASQSLIEKAENNLRSHADFRLARILDFVAQEKRWLKAVVHSEEVVEHTRNLTQSYQQEGVDSEIFRHEYEQFQEEHQVLGSASGNPELFLLNNDGELMFTMGAAEDELGVTFTEEGFYGESIFSSVIQQVKSSGDISLSNYGYLDMLEYSTVLIAAPIHDQGNLIGILVRPLSLDWMRNMLSNYSGLGETGDVIIAQKDLSVREEVTQVNFINLLRSDVERSQQCIELQQQSPEQFPILRFAMSKTGFGGDLSGSGWVLDPKCEEVFSVWSWLPELKWGMLVKQDRKEVLAPVTALGVELLGALLLSLALLVWISRRQAHSLSLPLVNLMNDARSGRLEHGQWIDECEVREIQQLALALRDYQQRVDEANQAKDEFLASMSHELRTPLTSIIGNSECLLESIEGDEAKQLAQSIESAGRAQLALVNDVLDIAKMESGKFTIDRHPYDLMEMASNLKKMFATQAINSGVLLEVEVKTTPEYQLMGDAQRVSQILVNLIGNALKFTVEGKVTVTISVQEKELHFVVEDTGIGMSSVVQKQLFERFHQADSSISRRFGGSGLGLHISITLAEVMGGTIQVSSEEQVGSRFELILPLQWSGQKAGTFAQSDKVQQSCLLGHVLLAEDTPELQMLVCRMLEGMGLQVTKVNNGEEAVEEATQQHYDMILMDMQMPVMDGIEATRVLKAQGCATPIVALTANVMQKHREAFENAGVDGFLAKPIDRTLLRGTLEQFLALDESRSIDDCVVQTQHADVEHSVSAIESDKSKRLREHLVDDELMALFVERVEQMRQQLMDALSAQDWQQVKQVAHTVKGAGSSFGYPELTEKGAVICNAVERDQLEQLPTQCSDLLEAMSQVSCP